MINPFSAAPAYDQDVIRGEFNQASSGPTKNPALENAQTLGHTPRTGEFTPDDARAIYIRGYGKTSATDSKPVLGTNGIVPCLAVAIYNREEKTGALAHFDTRTDVSSLDKLMADMGGKNQPLEVHLSGGDAQSTHSRKMVEQVIEKLDGYKNAQIVSADILGDSPMRSLALDTRTGTTYSQFMGNQLDKGENHQALMNHHARTAMQELPLRPEYIDGQSFSPSAPEAKPQALKP